MSAIIQMKCLCKYYTDGSNTLRVLEDINLEVLEGEILCILGPSGCGKSTLLRQIAGFDNRDSGQVLMHSKEITKPEVSRIMIFQDFNQLFPWKTVINNVIYPLQANGIGQVQARREVALNYLRMVELEGFEDSFPHQLSGGMKQKAALARALALEPEVLLMDEPFGSVDALTRNSLQEMLLKVWQSKRGTIVFVTHDIQEAVVLSDRIAVMGRKNRGIKQIIDNPLARPRLHGDQGFSEMYRQIYDQLDVYAQ